jgi:hypothetical protein
MHSFPGKIVHAAGFALCVSAFAAIISCSNTFSDQERLVRDFIEAARNHDVSKAVELMPRLSLLSSEQQKLALDNLSQIGKYKITGSRKEGDSVIVTLQFLQGSDVTSLIIPVRKEGESWIIGDDFRVRRSLEGETIERKN